MIKQKIRNLFLGILCVAAALSFSSCSGQSGQTEGEKEAADFNAVWESGLSAAAPFADAEPRDLTTHIGYIQPFPNQIEIAMGMDQILILLPRTDVTGGPGRLTLNREDDSSEIQQIAFDNQAVQFLPMTKQELSDMGWEMGTKVSITFDEMLTSGSYAVEMEEGCILAPNFDIKSPAYTDVWSFQVAEYGIAGGDYSSGDSYHAKVGDTVSLQIALGGEAAECRLQITPENAAETETYELFENGTFHIAFTQPGDIVYSVFFYNAQGEEMGILDQSVTVTQ